MRKLLLILATTFSMLYAEAQTVEVDLQVGITSPKGSAFEHCVRAGIGYSLDVMYAPGLLDDQLSFGIAKDGNLIFLASGSWKQQGVDLHASILGLWGAKSRFSLNNNGPRPYGALTIGAAHLKSFYLYDEFGDGSSLVTNKLEDYKFCVKPEIGVAFGCFTVSMGWIIPTEFCDKSTGYKLRATALQYNIGFRF